MHNNLFQMENTLTVTLVFKSHWKSRIQLFFSKPAEWTISHEEKNKSIKLLLRFIHEKNKKCLCAKEGKDTAIKKSLNPNLININWKIEMLEIINNIWL